MLSDNRSPASQAGAMTRTPLSSYQKRLFVFLSVATFFEGYDYFALAQVLPELRGELGLSPEQGASLVAVINVGTVLAYPLVSRADRWGRRKVLTLTIIGYTIFSLLSGLAPNAILFALAQLCARIFLIAEWAVTTVYAAEEYPADRRGLVIGVIQACSSLGAIICAGVVPLLLKLPMGWRSVYFVGAIPLLIVAFARRNLKETNRFIEQGPVDTHRSFMQILRSPYRTRVLQLALIWALTYICTQNAITFWKEFAIAERGFTNEQVGSSMSIAALVSMPLVFMAGKLLDWVGRRWGAVVIFVVTSLGVLGAYSFHSRAALTVSLMLGIFGSSSVLPVLNAYTAELFPTDLRSDAFAWANNLLGRIGYVLSPILVGAVAGQFGWGPAVSATAVFPIVALALIWILMPETSGKELEETSVVSQGR